MLHSSLLRSFVGKDTLFGRSAALTFVRFSSNAAAQTPSHYKAIKPAGANAVTQKPISGSESVSDKVYRWMDITGLLTRYNNRKAWVLDQDPYGRLSTVMITEYERKFILFMGFHCYLFFLASMAGFFYLKQHLNVKPPVPKIDFEYIDGRSKDFTWHGRLFLISPKERCKECRWLDLECKKECFERLREEGHSQMLYGGLPLSKPRDKLEPPHHH